VRLKIELRRRMMEDHKQGEDHPVSIRDTQPAGLSFDPGLDPVGPNLVSWTESRRATEQHTGDASMASTICLPETRARRRQETACIHEVGCGEGVLVDQLPSTGVTLMAWRSPEQHCADCRMAGIMPPHRPQAVRYIALRTATSMFGGLNSFYGRALYCQAQHVS
jgi:hypothetical protein